MAIIRSFPSQRLGLHSRQCASNSREWYVSIEARRAERPWGVGTATVELVYDAAFADYRFPLGHPMRPERFTLALELARAWGILDTLHIVGPEPASVADLTLAHTTDYVAHVMAASREPARADLAFGLGPGDTPAVAGIHDAAALVVGATIEALSAVVDGRARRAFNPAGGLHHAQRDRASGFCVYNDLVVAIERATRDHPGLRVAYVDIDAHHGDGVESAFIERDDVLTVSVHESGRFLFPGTGTRPLGGEGAGAGFALNVPLLPDAGDDEYLAAIDEVLAPAVRRFAPDVIVAQLGADSHAGDPLTHLLVTTPGFVEAVRRITALADEVCDGRLAATGGGGYQPFDVVPVMWASALAVLADLPVPTTLPAEWLALAAEARERAK